MKAVILAGGVGSRLSEETHLRPKPMVEIGGRPILWHIMKIYAAHDITDFVVCLGYKGYVIKEYFANFFIHGLPEPVVAVGGELPLSRQPLQRLSLPRGLVTGDVVDDRRVEDEESSVDAAGIP